MHTLLYVYTAVMYIIIDYYIYVMHTLLYVYTAVMYRLLYLCYVYITICIHYHNMSSLHDLWTSNNYKYELSTEETLSRTILFEILISVSEYSTGTHVDYQKKIMS